ncbi:hypothetical protein FH039_06665 [Thermococcus indicus]|uniref:Rubrerythrin diiron-binding domain-containing protein n=1 Tax=Thermococcus indicus TaxID=2586643 RepID=A0A4Y5SLT9_9EURY|nr:ferritin family protein [Thermococcus indicus]QDA31344.1 hypothetical protein FH039_06665 [Thermococcus indicus]
MEITDKEVFEIAINAEIRAKEAYEKLASLSTSDIIRDELLFLAKEEDKHREIIEKMAEKFEGARTEPKKIEIDVMGEFRVIAEKLSELVQRPGYPDIYREEFYDQLMKDINFNF